MVPMGSSAIRMVSMTLVIGLGFSNGCVELALNQPPPLVPRCLIDARGATIPRARFCWPRDVADGVETGAGVAAAVGTAAGAPSMSGAGAAAAGNGPLSV